MTEKEGGAECCAQIVDINLHNQEKLRYGLSQILNDSKGVVVLWLVGTREAEFLVRTSEQVTLERPGVTLRWE